MKNLSIIGVLLLILACSSEQNNSGTTVVDNIENVERRNSSWLWIDNEVGEDEWLKSTEFDSVGFSGTLINFYDNGHFYSKSILRNGQVDTLKMYDTTGTLIYSEWYSANGWKRVEYEKLGSFSWFYQNLSIRKTGNIIKSENEERGNREFLNGEVITFFENGDTASIEHFKDWEFKDGEFKTWYENGQLASVENFILNGRTGKFEVFDKDGILLKNGDFGFMTGKEREYYPSGTIKSEIGYYQYQKSGNAKYYLESGELEKTMYFDGDSLVSEELHITN